MANAPALGRLARRSFRQKQVVETRLRLLAKSRNGRWYACFIGHALLEKYGSPERALQRLEEKTIELSFRELEDDFEDTDPADDDLSVVGGSRGLAMRQLELATAILLNVPVELITLVVDCHFIENEPGAQIAARLINGSLDVDPYFHAHRQGGYVIAQRYLLEEQRQLEETAEESESDNEPVPTNPPSTRGFGRVVAYLGF